MDAVDAPQWADFDASVRSDIDEYFNVEHEELEPDQFGDLQYHSCPGTPNSQKPIGGSPYKTPKSDSTQSSQELSGYMKNLQITGEKKSLRGKMSITPRTYALKKCCANLKKALTPGIAKPELVTSDGVQTAEHQSANGSEKSSNDCTNAERIIGGANDSEDAHDVEDENAEHNCTLVATEESVKNPQSQCNDHNDEICAQPVSETIVKAADRVAEAAEQKVEKLEEPVVSVAPLARQISEAKVQPPMEPEKTEKVKSTVLKGRVDSLKHGILDSKKNPRAKPTVLTSHARRRSTSNFRRLSANYVPLAEALSKFQNCTPERFRSSNKKTGKGSSAPGPLQKVKQAAKKATDARSPLLRCKYRSRAVTVPKQEEIKNEEIRKNQKKTELIKQAAIKCQKDLRTASTLSEPTSKLKKTTGNELLKKTDKKPTTTTEALPLTHTTTKNNGPIIVKKSDQPAIINGDLSSRPKTAMNPPQVGEKAKKASSIANPLSSSRRTMMNPPKTGDQMKKSSSIPDSLTASRRTMMNPPKAAFGKANVPTKASSALASSRKIMMNPPAPLIKIENKSTATSMNPPKVVKKLGSERKPHAAESRSFLDKTNCDLILSSTILSESMRKNTPCKKVIPSVVSTDIGASIKAEEISHCGIPVGNAYKKITEAIPFSFASHNKGQSQNKKNTMKNRDDAAEKKTKPFQARPVPSYVIKPSPKTVKPATKPLVIADAPFSFQERDQNISKKKKEMFEQMIEREKQNRIFHARPAPKFKPVFVRGVSSENLRTTNATENHAKLSQETRLRALSHGAIADDRENTEPNIIASNKPFPKLKNPLTDVNRKFKKIAV